MATRPILSKTKQEPKVSVPAPVEEKKQELSSVIPGDPPADLMSAMQADAGKGLSQAADDNIVPLIYILQANSPQVQRGNAAAYLPGAVSGDLWKRNSSIKEVVKGEEGLLFQSCAFWKGWIEWKRPGRGAFVARHDERPNDAVEKDIRKESGEPAKAWIRANGNEVVETREHIGYADGEPYVIPFSSTGHTVSKQWMQLMNQFYIPGTTQIAPSWSRKYRVTTKSRTKGPYTWNVISIADAGWVSSWDEYNKGKALNSAFAAGEKQSAAPEVASDEDAIEGSYAEVSGSPASDIDSEIPF